MHKKLVIVNKASSVTKDVFYNRDLQFTVDTNSGQYKLAVVPGHSHLRQSVLLYFALYSQFLVYIVIIGPTLCSKFQ